MIVLGFTIVLVVLICAIFYIKYLTDLSSFGTNYITVECAYNVGELPWCAEHKGVAPKKRLQVKIEESYIVLCLEMSKNNLSTYVFKEELPNNTRAHYDTHSILRYVRNKYYPHDSGLALDLTAQASPDKVAVGYWNHEYLHTTFLIGLSKDKKTSEKERMDIVNKKDSKDE